MPSALWPPFMSLTNPWLIDFFNSKLSNILLLKPIRIKPTLPPLELTTALVAKVVDKETKEILPIGIKGAFDKDFLRALLRPIARLLLVVSDFPEETTFLTLSRNPRDQETYEKDVIRIKMIEDKSLISWHPDQDKK